MSPTHPPTRSLAEHPHLDQLKRQAKELLSAFRDGQPGAVSEVHQLYRGADPATFALHDAQLVLARAYGFDSWRQLKAFVDGATVARLVEAVRAADATRVEAMLAARPEIVNMDVSGNDEHRAIHHAVLTRNPAMVRLLLAHGADPHIGIYPYRDATSALRIARDRGYDDIVAIIEEADQGRGQGRRLPGGGPPLPDDLNDAINRGDSRAAIEALESNPMLRANPELIKGSGPGGITLLHLAAARLMPELAAWLLDRGVDVNRQQSNGLAPIDMLGRWPIGQPHDKLATVANMLLERGAQRTAFWAIATGNVEWLRAKHAEGKLENHVLDVGGLVTYAVRVDRPEILALLLDLGFDPNERPRDTPDGKPLEYSAIHRRFEMASLLLRRGASLTPRLAIALGQTDWLRARHSEGLLDHPPDGDGLLTTAVEHNRADVLKLLLELGFDANERMRRGTGEEAHGSQGNALNRCVEKRNVALAEILLAHGADPNLATEGGGSPLATAYRNRDHAMLDLFGRYGGVVSAGTAAYHRDVAIAKQRIEEEDAGRLRPGSVTPGRTVAEDLLDGDCGEPEIVSMALERIDWPPDDPRWYNVLRGPLSFWNHIPWIESANWKLDRGGYLTCFRMLLARTHANIGGRFGRTLLHDVMAMGKREGQRDWITDEEVLAFATTLLDAGARVDVRDDLLQSTPLAWACRWNRAPVVKELLDRGVDAVEADAPAWATPRAWAEKMGQGRIVEVLNDSNDSQVRP